MTDIIYNADALSKLRELESESIDCVVTSPPYWALRDYGTAEWDGGDSECDHQVGRNTRGGLSEMQKTKPGSFGDEAILNGHSCPKCGAVRQDSQLGLESTPEAYIERLCAIFDEIRRVLKPTGTCWVNIGDTYYGGGRNAGNKNPKIKSKQVRGLVNLGDTVPGPKGQSKCLVQIPARFAIAMTDRGWILRNELIWHKPNAMPSSVRDRFTVDYEKIYFFTKSRRYYFEQQFEPQRDWGTRDRSKGKYKGAGLANGLSGNLNPKGRNKRSVWSISTKPYKEAHFATFPPELIETPIRAGCPEGGGST